MTVTATGGRSSVTVTSGAAVDLLSSATDASSGLALGGPGSVDWSLVVTTRDNGVAVKVYLAAGANALAGAGLVEVTGYGQTVTTAAPLQLQVPREASSRIRVTAQATGSDAHVDCDFRAVAVSS